MNRLFDGNILATCAEKRDDLAKYLAKDFVPDPAKRYRWYFGKYDEANPLCIEYDVLSETRCFETVGFLSDGHRVIPLFKPKRVCKTAIKKFAHRSPVAALYSLYYKQRMIARIRMNEHERAKARGDSAHDALEKAGVLLKFNGVLTDIPEYSIGGRP